MFYGPSVVGMPIVDGYQATFTTAAMGHAVDDALLWRIADALAAHGFRAKRRGLGSSGMETCFSISSDRVEIAMICCTSPGESDPSFWHPPLWFWRRWFGRGPTSAEVDEALETIKDACERVLGGDSQISNVRCVTMKQRAAEIRATIRNSRH